MVDVWEEYANEKANDSRIEARKEMAIALLKEKIFTISKIAELTKLSIEEISQDQLQNA